MKIDHTKSVWFHDKVPAAHTILPLLIVIEEEKKTWLRIHVILLSNTRLDTIQHNTTQHNTTGLKSKKILTQQRMPWRCLCLSVILTR